MSTKPIPPGDLRTIWQSMPVETIAVSADEMRAKAQAFQTKVRRRNRIEYVATAFVVTTFSWYATFPSKTWLWPIANIMIIVGVLVVAANLHRRARAGVAPETGSAAMLIDFQRSELVRQRDALRTVWLWYVLPVAPGVIAWFIAAAIGLAEKNPERTLLALGGTALVVTLVFATIILLNLLGAARLQRAIDALDHYREKP